MLAKQQISFSILQSIEVLIELKPTQQASSRSPSSICEKSYFLIFVCKQFFEGQKLIFL